MLDSYHISRCRYKQNTLYQSGLNKFHSSNSPTQLGLDPEKNMKENREDYIEGIENANKITLSLLLL